VDDGRERQGVADSANGREANGTGDPTIDCDPVLGLAKAIQRIGVAAKHGGFELAQQLIVRLTDRERNRRCVAQRGNP
jgi:hypothetical protein